jgi:hypothetical protein
MGIAAGCAIVPIAAVMGESGLRDEHRQRNGDDEVPLNVHDFDSPESSGNGRNRSARRAVAE